MIDSQNINQLSVASWIDYFISSSTLFRLVIAIKASISLNLLLSSAFRRLIMRYYPIYRLIDAALIGNIFDDLFTF